MAAAAMLLQPMPPGFSQRTGDTHVQYNDIYLANCKFVVEAFGDNRLVDDLASDNFQALRAGLFTSNA